MSGLVSLKSPNVTVFAAQSATTVAPRGLPALGARRARRRRARGRPAEVHMVQPDASQQDRRASPRRCKDVTASGCSWTTRGANAPTAVAAAMRTPPPPTTTRPPAGTRRVAMACVSHQDQECLPSSRENSPPAGTRRTTPRTARRSRRRASSRGTRSRSVTTRAVFLHACLPNGRCHASCTGQPAKQNVPSLR